MKLHQKRVHGAGDPTGPTSVKVKLTLDKREATRFFHDINRVLSLLDEVCPNLQDQRHADHADQASYDRVNEFIDKLQRELQIPPSEETK